ncbi:MAG: exosome complex exonuclease Rrp41 [Candidatus Micrarchaeia archaeon]|jgi:exosome complex component RRP41
MVGGAMTKELFSGGKRLDGRGLEDLRPLKIKAAVLNKAEGSAYVEWGGNKILAAVYGPRECIPRHDTDPYRAVLRCRYRMSPFASKDEHGRIGPNRRATELSKVIRETFENVVLLEQFPKTQIDIFVEVLQADGGSRCASIVAASVALADAGIPMKDLVGAVAVGMINGKMALDLTGAEDNFGESDIPVAVASRNKDILLFQMDGELTREQVNDALAMAVRASDEIHAKQVAALMEVYESKMAAQGGNSD